MIINFSELQNIIKQKDRLLGIDLGEKTIGLSLSDNMTSIATPYSLIKRQSINQDIKEVLSVVESFNIPAIIIGYPLNMNGSKGPSCERVDKFIANFTIPFLLWDERLSTVAVERTLIDANISRKKRSLHIDKMAAAYILQGALDRLRLLKK